MNRFAQKPLGYLIVGGLAMVLGLSTGVGIGFFFSGTETEEPVQRIAELKAQDKDVVVLPSEKQRLVPIPDPLPIPVPAQQEIDQAQEKDEENWTAIPGLPEERTNSQAATQAPAPWPELAEKIEQAKREKEEKQRLIAEQQKAAETRRNAWMSVPEVDDPALAGDNDLWPDPAEEQDHLAGLQPQETENETPGDRIDREAQAWEANSVTVADPGGKPMISIVIDDLGLNRRNTVRTIRLPGPLTLAFLTYAEDLERQTSSAHAAGHELMVHFPMEPRNPLVDTGPNALRRSMREKELRRRLEWGLSRFKGYVGINNHMGSAFTSDPVGMAVVMDEVRKRGVLYLDSLTTQRSAGRLAAGVAGVPFVARDVFLDNAIDARQINERLAEVEAVARRKGHAIAIGHPHGATIEALANWIPKLEQAGFALVPVSMIVKHRRGS